MLKAVLMKPVADAQAGEVVVSFTPSSAARNVRITVETVQASGTPQLVFIPDAEHGGYLVADVAAGMAVERLFTAKPVDAKVGTDFQCVAYARGDGVNETS